MATPINPVQSPKLLTPVIVAAAAPAATQPAKPVDRFVGSPNAKSVAEWSIFCEALTMIGPGDAAGIEQALQGFSDKDQQNAARITRDLFRKPNITKQTVNADIAKTFSKDSPLKARLQKLVDGIYDETLAESSTKSNEDPVRTYFSAEAQPNDELFSKTVNFVRKARLSYQVVTLARGQATWLYGLKNDNAGPRAGHVVYYFKANQPFEVGFRSYRFPRDFFNLNRSINDRLKALDSNLGLMLIPAAPAPDAYGITPMGLVQVERRVLETKIPETLGARSANRQTAYMVGTPLANTPQLGVTVSGPEHGLSLTYRDLAANNARLNLLSMDDAKYPARLQIADPAERKIVQTLKSELNLYFSGAEGQTKLTAIYIDENGDHEKFHDVCASIFAPIYDSTRFLSPFNVEPNANNALVQAEECLCELNKLRELVQTKDEYKAKALLVRGLISTAATPNTGKQLVATSEFLAHMVLMRAATKNQDGRLRFNFDLLSQLTEKSSVYCVDYMRRTISEKVLPQCIEHARQNGLISGNAPAEQQSNFDRYIAGQKRALLQTTPNLSNLEAEHLVYNHFFTDSRTANSPAMQSLGQFVFSDTPKFQMDLARDILGFKGKTAQEFRDFSSQTVR